LSKHHAATKGRAAGRDAPQRRPAPGGGAGGAPAAPGGPPLEPPAVRARFQGLRVAPKTGLTVFGPKANSGVLVLPTTIAPAARRRWTTSASSSGTWFSKSLEPCVVRMPFVGVTSLIATGTPNIGGRAAPRRNAAVASRA